MKWPVSLFVVILYISASTCQDDGGSEGSTGGHDQPAPDQRSPDANKGEKGSDGKTPPEQGYTQGFNQGVKPYSYGYNTGIKPYSYNFYQPLGGKPQVVEEGGPEGEKAPGGPKAAKSAEPAVQASPPPLPAIEFPADFSAFGLSPADLAIPPPPAQAGQKPASGQLNAQRWPQPVPVNYPVQAAARPVEPGASGQTPPPFNYGEYGIPTDIGTATGSAAGSPFGILDGGAQPQQQRGQPQRMMDGDDFGIFGGGGNGNSNNGLTIPVLEDGNNQNNQQNLAIPLFSGGSGNQNQGNDFNFANNDLANDFNVAASDFEPFNFQNFVPPEFARTVPLVAGSPAGDTPGPGSTMTQKGGKMSTPVAQIAASQTASSKQKKRGSTSSALQESRPSMMDRKAMYQAAAPESAKKAKRSVNEQPHEEPLKDDPNSAYNILNMDPKYTNPNQGVYSYYPAYRVPS